MYYLTYKLIKTTLSCLYDQECVHMGLHSPIFLVFLHFDTLLCLKQLSWHKPFLELDESSINPLYQTLKENLPANPLPKIASLSPKESNFDTHELVTTHIPAFHALLANQATSPMNARSPEKQLSIGIFGQCIQWSVR